MTDFITDSRLGVNPRPGEIAMVKFLGNTEDLRPYTPIGPLHYLGSYNQYKPDVINRLFALTKTGQKVFEQIKNFRDKDTNIITINHWNNLNQTELKFIQRGLRNLYESKIICKAKPFSKYLFKPERYTFMVNPYIIKCNHYTKAKEFWYFFTGQEKDFE